MGPPLELLKEKSENKTQMAFRISNQGQFLQHVSSKSVGHDFQHWNTFSDNGSYVLLIDDIQYYCWRALARQHTILFSRAKNPKFFSDVRFEACAVESYPGHLKRQSRAHLMAVMSSGITLHVVI